jgi:hypothetical protein
VHKAIQRKKAGRRRRRSRQMEDSTKGERGSLAQVHSCGPKEIKQTL